MPGRVREGWLLALAFFALAATSTEAAPVEVARSKKGMVVAGHPEAAEIGVDVLRRGGNAMDAAVAVSMALGVAEPYGSGLGGKLMMLYYDADEERVFAVDAMDEAGASLDVAAFLALTPEQRTEGWGSVAVPGLVAGLYEGHRRWGRLEWAAVVTPAADLARRGSLVLEQTRTLFERRLDKLRSHEETSRLFLPDGHLPAVGQRLANPDLARTLETLAREGRQGFYGGWVAQALVRGSREGGGFLTAQDLAGYSARVSEPLTLDFRGLRIASAPPPATGGATVLAALSRLEDARWHGGSPLEPRNLDRIGGVLRSLYPEVQARIADVATAREAFRQLTVSSPQRAEPEGLTDLGSSTTHFVVVDEAGNVASVTQSLSHHFGSGVVAPGTGVVLNNTLKNFTTGDPASVNFVAPSKRPRSTIAPTLVFRGRTPVLALGVPGGQRIPTATLQVLLDAFVFKTGMERALRRPRVHLRRPLQAQAPDNVFEMEVADARLARALQARGWSVEVNEDRETFGGFCAVEIRADGTRVGLADRRRTNAARGY